MTTKLLALFIVGIAAVPIAAPSAQPPHSTESPQALGFAHLYKCPSDRDVDRLGDTVTPQARLEACEQHGHAAGCWWLDGTGGFPRQCRVCRTLTPQRMHWPNDWALPLSVYTS
jgi:hypothetical protein